MASPKGKAKPTPKKEPGQYSQIDLNPDQQAAYELAKGPAKYLLFYGPGGSGKSFLILYMILLRALRAPGSRHAIFRTTLASCRETLFDKTLRPVFEAAYPGFILQCKVSESEMTVELPNGSLILFDGLNDEQRLDKVLGQEYNTIWLNECNDFDYKAVSRLLSRLRYKTKTLDGAILRNKLYADCNPASKKDWEYLAFVEKVNPTDKNVLRKPEDWDSIKLHTELNLHNLSEDYIDNMEATLTVADRKRFVEGEWANDTEGGLFKQVHIDSSRIPVDNLASIEQRKKAVALKGKDIVDIAISFDPAMTDKKDSDEHGIIVVGVDSDGHGYAFEDLSTKGSPMLITDRVVGAYKDWGASKVIYESNQGGDWLPESLRKDHPNIYCKPVRARLKKHARAEPVSDLYERGRVHHVGSFPALEAQMTEFGSLHSSKSPDRMDALVHGLTEVMDIRGEGPAQVVQLKSGIFG